MAHHTLQAGAPNLPIGPGMKLVLEAIDPTTDASVAGVTSTRWTIYGRDLSGVDPTGVVPLYSPEDVAEQV